MDDGDIVLRPADGDTSLAEVARGGTWRLHTPFAFELTLPGSGTVEVRLGGWRTDTSFSLEREALRTDGGRASAQIRETLVRTHVRPATPSVVAGRARTHTTFALDAEASEGEASEGEVGGV